MAASPFADGGLSAPAHNGTAITPNDSTDLVTNTRAIFIGTTGNLSVILASDQSNSGAGTAVVFKNLASGSTLNIRARRINATLTTATDIVALW